MASLKRKGHARFGTREESKRPTESIFQLMVFKPLVFGTFGDMSSSARGLIEMVVEYGVEQLGMNMAATTVDIAMSTLRRRYKTQMSLAT